MVRLFGLMAAMLGVASPVLAESLVIHPGGFPTPVGEVAVRLSELYNVLFLIIAVIAVIVAVPLVYILWRYRQRKVGKPATFSHHMGLELLWTIVPALICVFITYESWLAMRVARTLPEGGMNVEAVAYQFGWDFFYPDYSENGVHVTAAEPTAVDAQLSSAGEERRVKELVVPTGMPIKLQVTAADVIHAFFAPNLGVKIDAVPGRINYAWFQADTPGKYLGQCAELCGSAHGEMFFYVTAVSPEDFDRYIQARRVDAGLTPVRLAEAPAEATPTAPVSATDVSASDVGAGVAPAEAVVSPSE